MDIGLLEEVFFVYGPQCTASSVCLLFNHSDMNRVTSNYVFAIHYWLLIPPPPFFFFGSKIASRKSKHPLPVLDLTCSFLQVGYTCMGVRHIEAVGVVGHSLSGRSYSVTRPLRILSGHYIYPTLSIV